MEAVQGAVILNEIEESHRRVYADEPLEKKSLTGRVGSRNAWVKSGTTALLRLLFKNNA